MSRIRSVHPGLWTDEKFVAVSAMARLLFMGIWTECDDYGSFEWSPIKLKMRLLPADPADAIELLAELAESGAIMRYEVDGKPYGAVRNFCQYQRPKKPNQSYPQTDEVRNYVNTEARSTRDGSEPVGDQLPTPSEKSRQMKDEGDKREGSSDELPKARKRADAKIQVEVPDWMPAKQWAAMVSLREQMTKAKPPILWSLEAAEGIISKITRLRGEGHDPAKLLEKAVVSSWRTVFEGDDTRADKNGSSGPMTAEQCDRTAEILEGKGNHETAAVYRSSAAKLRGKTVSVDEASKALLAKMQRVQADARNTEGATH